jgi:hypothetical protein
MQKLKQQAGRLKMPIKFVCPGCASTLTAADEIAGRDIVCRNCGTTITVPDANPGAAYGAAVVRSQPKGRRVNVVFICSVLLILVAFALPWMSLPADAPEEVRSELAGYTTGYGLPFLVGKVEGIARSRPMTDNQRERLRKLKRTSRILLVLYIIPLLGVLCVVDEVISARKGKNHWHLRLLHTVFPVVALALVVFVFAAVLGQIEDGQPMQRADSASSLPFYSMIPAGIYALGAGVLMSFISIFMSPKPPVNKPTS